MHANLNIDKRTLLGHTGLRLALLFLIASFGGGVMAASTIEDNEGDPDRGGSLR